MTILEKVSLETRNIFNMFFDKEPLNYLEAAGLYGIIAQGRYNVAALEVLYNHAEDQELKSLIKEAMERHTKTIVENSEEILQESGARIPSLAFTQRTLHKTPINIPPDAHLTNEEVAIAVGTMGKAAQMALLAALHQSYQLEVAMMYRKMLDAGLEMGLSFIAAYAPSGLAPKTRQVGTLK